MCNMQIENINVEELSVPKGGQIGLDSKSVRDTHVRQVDRQAASYHELACPSWHTAEFVRSLPV